MFKVGDLVRYRKSSVDNDSIGLVIRQNLVFPHLWHIKWIDGSKYQEDEMHLELVKN